MHPKDPTDTLCHLTNIVKKYYRCWELSYWYLSVSICLRHSQWLKLLFDKQGKDKELLFPTSIVGPLNVGLLTNKKLKECLKWIFVDIQLPNVVVFIGKNTSMSLFPSLPWKCLQQLWWWNLMTTFPLKKNYLEVRHFSMTPKRSENVSCWTKICWIIATESES